MRPNLNALVAAERVTGDTPEETAQIRQFTERASAYLQSFDWCRGVLNLYSGIALPGILGVYLAHIKPGAPDVDEWVWVVVGDLPPAYIVTDDAPTASAALEGYIGEMRAWAEAVKLGQPLDDLIPVNAPPTREYADRLESRMSFLEEHVLEDEAE